MRAKVLGSLIGGALGDAWGLPYEKKPAPIEFKPPMEAFAVSDDTQLTIATCESLIARRRIDPADIAQRFLDLYRVHGIHGAGSSTIRAMQNLDAGMHWAFAGARGEYAAGKGAASRIAPIALWPSANESDVADVCRITHHNDEALAGALAVFHAIRFALAGDLVELPLRVAAKLPDSAIRDRIEDPRAVSRRTGHVAESIPVALQIAVRIETVPFERPIREAIEGGGDADTIASIVGQIAGAQSGVGGIPAQAFRNKTVISAVNRFAAAL